MIRLLVSTLLLNIMIDAYGQEEEVNTPRGMVLIPGGTFMMAVNHRIIILEEKLSGADY